MVSKSKGKWKRIGGLPGSTEDVVARDVAAKLSTGKSEPIDVAKKSVKRSLKKSSKNARQKKDDKSVGTMFVEEKTGMLGHSKSELRNLVSGVKPFNIGAIEPALKKLSSMETTVALIKIVDEGKPKKRKIEVSDLWDDDATDTTDIADPKMEMEILHSKTYNHGGCRKSVHMFHKQMLEMEKEPAVPLPLQGQSINPAFSTWQETLTAAVEDQKKLESQVQKLDAEKQPVTQFLIERFPKQVSLIRDDLDSSQRLDLFIFMNCSPDEAVSKLTMEFVKKAHEFHQSRLQRNGEGDDEDSGNEYHMKLRSFKTRSQRARTALHNQRVAENQVKKRLKERENDFEKLDEILKKTVVKEAGNKTGNKVIKMSKVKLGHIAAPEHSIAVSTSAELAKAKGGARQTFPVSLNSLFQEKLVTLQRRGDIERQEQCTAHVFARREEEIRYKSKLVKHISPLSKLRQ